jgi:hypothetical protein
MFKTEQHMIYQDIFSQYKQEVTNWPQVITNQTRVSLIIFKNLQLECILHYIISIVSLYMYT